MALVLYRQELEIEGGTSCGIPKTNIQLFAFEYGDQEATECIYVYIGL